MGNDGNAGVPLHIEAFRLVLSQVGIGENTIHVLVLVEDRHEHG